MSYSTEALRDMTRKAKEKRLGELFSDIEDARLVAFQLRGDAASAELRVDRLLADARKLMLTD